MPTPAERQALLFLATVLVLGTGVRIARARSPVPPPSARQALAGQLAAVDSAIARRGRAPAGRSTRAASPAPGRAPAPVDLDTAPESLLVTLPGIGPALARRIAQDRAKVGPFGSVSALTRVPGIGEKTAARLAPHVTFSGAPRHPR